MAKFDLTLSEPTGILGNNTWRAYPPLSRDRRHREAMEIDNISIFVCLLALLRPTLPPLLNIYYIYKYIRKRAAERPVQARKRQ